MYGMYHRNCSYIIVRMAAGTVSTDTVWCTNNFPSIRLCPAIKINGLYREIAYQFRTNCTDITNSETNGWYDMQWCPDLSKLISRTVFNFVVYALYGLQREQGNFNSVHHRIKPTIQLLNWWLYGAMVWSNCRKQRYSNSGRWQLMYGGWLIICGNQFVQVRSWQEQYGWHNSFSIYIFYTFNFFVFNMYLLDDVEPWKKISLFFYTYSFLFIFYLFNKL